MNKIEISLISFLIGVGSTYAGMKEKESVKYSPRETHMTCEYGVYRVLRDDGITTGAAILNEKNELVKCESNFDNE